MKREPTEQEHEKIDRAITEGDSNQHVYFHHRVRPDRGTAVIKARTVELQTEHPEKFTKKHH